MNVGGVGVELKMISRQILCAKCLGQKSEEKNWEEKSHPFPVTLPDFRYTSVQILFDLSLVEKIDGSLRNARPNKILHSPVSHLRMKKLK